MWLGVILREPPDGDVDLVTVGAWAAAPGAALRVTGAPGGIEEVARLLRGTQQFGARFGLPRCPGCRAVLDVPDVDAWAREGAVAP